MIKQELFESILNEESGAMTAGSIGGGVQTSKSFQQFVPQHMISLRPLASSIIEDSNKLSWDDFENNHETIFYKKKKHKK